MIILQANKLERSFSGDVLFDNINLLIDERDRIALVGKNGAGKSTLLKILVGEETPTSGEINKKKIFVCLILLKIVVLNLTKRSMKKC